jgi:hypothetical protein
MRRYELPGDSAAVLAYDGVCARMRLAYADVCGAASSLATAQQSWRMLTYAGVCGWRMLTYADVC